MVKILDRTLKIEAVVNSSGDCTHRDWLCCSQFRNSVVTVLTALTRNVKVRAANVKTAISRIARESELSACRGLLMYPLSQNTIAPDPATREENKIGLHMGSSRFVVSYRQTP